MRDDTSPRLYSCMHTRAGAARDIAAMANAARGRSIYHADLMMRATAYRLSYRKSSDANFSATMRAAPRACTSAMTAAAMKRVRVLQICFQLPQIKLGTGEFI